MLLLGGPDVSWTDEDDDDPLRWYEPLPSGPRKGSVSTREALLEEKKKYYEWIGWDERCIPTSEEL